MQTVLTLSKNIFTFVVSCSCGSNVLTITDHTLLHFSQTCVYKLKKAWECVTNYWRFKYISTQFTLWRLLRNKCFVCVCKWKVMCPSVVLMFLMLKWWKSNLQKYIKIKYLAKCELHFYWYTIVYILEAFFFVFIVIKCFTINLFKFTNWKNQQRRNEKEHNVPIWSYIITLTYAVMASAKYQVAVCIK